MTLGEFRKYTGNLDDSIELSYHYAGGNFPIGTMNPIGEDKIEFCSNNYGEESILGCLRVMAFLKQKEKQDMTQEEKINIAELLKGCPKGMELDCTMIDNVVFEKLDVRSSHHPIIIRRTDSKDLNTTIHLTKYGQYSDEEDYKCVIYPKGKTTWEGFVPPYSFNDGDIVATTNGLFVGIVEVKNNMPVGAYCSVDHVKDFRINSDYVFDRLATTWEKEKLFKAIKDNGYRWNPETKTLERLTPNKFDTTTLKPFDKVLVRDNNEQFWTCDWFSFHDTKQVYPFACVGHYVSQCIPYEENQHLLGTTNDCDNFYKTWE